MNVIDISNWQGGMNLNTMFKKNPDLDGVICKATGSNWFVDGRCDAWVQKLIEGDRPWGFYHFLCDGNRFPGGKAEAEWFVEHTSNYFGHGVPVADYESPATFRGTKYLKSFLDRVTELTGVKPVVYVSQAFIATQGFGDIAAAGYQLWLAQYADNNPVYGFQANPWQRGSIAPFDRYVMHQYTSHGRLPGWNGNLDLNLFYGDREAWETMVGGGAVPEPLKPADPVVVSAVLLNEYGTYDSVPSRAERLRTAGYDPTSVQDKIDKLYGVAGKVKPLVVGNEAYLNSIMKIVRSI